VPTTRQALLGGSLRRIASFSLETFRERLKLQKTVYLLQAFGIYLGYSYNWYLYGPYSPDLTRDAFEVVPRLRIYKPVHFADQDTETRFEQFVQFLGHKRDDPQWLELVASLHMLRRIYGDQDKKTLFRKMADKQPYLAEADRAAAWGHLQDYRLV
jgi:uncharacterized protein YwgA